MYSIPEVVHTQNIEIPEPLKDVNFWREKSLTDLWFHASNVLSHGKKEEYRDLNWVHCALADFLDLDKNPIPQKLVIMSRDLLKSTMSRALINQWFVKKAYYGLPGKIGIYCGVYELAEDNLDRVMKEILTNEILQSVFYKWLPHKNSDFGTKRKERIRFNGIEIEIGSPERPLTGFHFEGVVNDNLNNEINTATFEQCQKINKRWRQQESVMSKNAWEIVWETTWETYDIAAIILDPDCKFDYGKLYRKPAYTFVSKTGYHVFTCPARDEKGDPVCPEKCDDAYLKRKRDKQGPYIYSRMYELRPIPDEEIVLRSKWLLPMEELPYNFIRNISVDCAGTTRAESSFSAISICDWDELGRMNISFADKRKLTPMELYNWICEVVAWSESIGRPVTFVGVEKEKYGISIASYHETSPQTFNLWLIDIRGRTRNSRIQALAPYGEQGKILVQRGLSKLEDEWSTYHKDKKRGVDILDTMGYHLDMKVIPEKIEKVAWVPNVPDDVRGQFRREMEMVKGGHMNRKQINAVF
ncbi:MAG TPA: hypothetical protein ENI27_09130 [bacterium]|nr:hypothetical protein [bacterium]